MLVMGDATHSDLIPQRIAQSVDVGLLQPVDVVHQDDLRSQSMAESVQSVQTARKM